MKYVLITGAGNLGLAIHTHFSGTDDFDPVIASRKRRMSGPEDTIQCDIVRHELMNNIISKVKPVMVIHTAAMTNVDLCEREPERAHEVNAAGTENLATTCAREGIPLIYISTDHVFDGTKGDYCENDRTGPINAYGRTKLEGERSVMGMTSNRWAVIRTSFLYNSEGPNYDFISHVINRISQGERMGCDVFRFTKATPCNCIGPVIENIVRNGKWGLYHVCGKRKLTPYAIAKECSDALDLDRSLICSRMKLPHTSAPRPVDPTLNTEKAQRGLGFIPPDLNMILRRDRIGK